MLHCPRVWSQGGEHTCVGPCLQEWALIHAGSKSLVGLASFGPRNAPVCAGNRARTQKCPNAKKPRGRDLAQNSKVPYQEPHAKSPHTKRATLPTSFRKAKVCSSGHKSAPNTSHMSVLDQAGPRSSISSGTIFHHYPDLQTLEKTPIRPPVPILNTWLRTSCVI